MVWFGMEGSESQTVNRLYNNQAGILPLNRGRYRAARAATKYKNIKIYAEMEASTEASREKMKTIESFSLGNLVRELKSKI